jgi:hypothetical protein
MALVVAVFNLVSYLVMFGLIKRLAPEMSLQRSLVERSTIRELAGYCASLTI